jgi:hypothetical protein
MARFIAFIDGQGIRVAVNMDQVEQLRPAAGNDTDTEVYFASERSLSVVGDIDDVLDRLNEMETKTATR